MSRIELQKMFTFSPTVLGGKIVFIKITYTSPDGSIFTFFAENPAEINPERFDLTGGSIEFENDFRISWDTKMIEFSSNLNCPARRMEFIIPVTREIQGSFADLINGWHDLALSL